jgi:UDP-N-acetylmuramate dehydrogenase
LAPVISRAQRNVQPECCSNKLKKKSRQSHEDKKGSASARLHYDRYWRPVPAVYLPETEQELSELLREFVESNQPYKIIGNGSNVLADDRGIDHVLIGTKQMERIFRVEGERITVDAGYPMAQLAYQSASKGLSGLEFGVGIPGSIGGVVRMNAGAHGKTIGEVVDSVRIILPGGEIREVSNKQLQFKYRSSAIPSDAVIVTVTLKLTSADSKQIHELIRQYNDQRTSTQPLKDKSAGCIFKNPEGSSAGKLIEVSGLKGFSIGGAMVSDVHANFIINRGNATFEDTLKLIDHIKRVVREKQGVTLEEEVIVWRHD